MAPADIRLTTLRRARGLQSLSEYAAFARSFAVSYATLVWWLDPAAIPDPGPGSYAVDAQPAFAFVSGGQWVAYCDLPGCPWREACVVEPGWPYMCAACTNKAIDHKWRPVAWPHNAVQIEALLLERAPLNHTMHWHPERDTLASLRAENKRKPWLRTAGGLVVAQRKPDAPGWQIAPFEPAE